MASPSAITPRFYTKKMWQNNDLGEGKTQIIESQLNGVWLLFHAAAVVSFGVKSLEKPGHFPSIKALLTFWPQPIVLVVCVGYSVYMKGVTLIAFNIFTVCSFLTNFFMIGEKCHYHCISSRVTCCPKWLRSQSNFADSPSSLLSVFVSFFFLLSLCSDRCQL